ncbi:MAG: hypothetical protein Q7R96_01840 [Nanoarchaeota archaeon]|nr:hypothetical protein [Nanoarchaeota archaeon]
MRITRLRECIDQKVILERRPVPAAPPERNVGVVVLGHEGKKDHLCRPYLSFIEPDYRPSKLWLGLASENGRPAEHLENPLLLVYTRIFDDDMVCYGHEEDGCKVFLGPLSYYQCLPVNDRHSLFAQYKALLLEKGFSVV